MATRTKNIVQRTKGVEKIVNKLLENRGIKSVKEKKEFFSPSSPCNITAKEFGINKSELDKAVKRIKKAIEDKEKIVVYGDYDVDGICSTAILWETLHALGADATPYLPSRFTDGYGLSKVGIESVILSFAKDLDSSSATQNDKIGLLITVDSGIVAFDGVNAARDAEIDVIVTDHHEPGDKMPDAFAVVHTTRVSGSAVSWILARELAKNSKSEARNSKLPDDHLGLAALGTIADVLPLVGFNRSIAVHGLKILQNTDRPGIRAICLEAGIEQKEIDTFHIGFVIAPRLNAMGRVEDAMESLRLLCTTNRTRARDLATLLGNTNKLRQDKTENVLNHVGTTFEPAWSDGNLPKILFVHHESYEEGVIGIAAGRLVEKYHRPTIVVARGEKTSKASVRSISGVNIIELLRSLGKDIFVNVGGHPMAAGFTIATEKLELLGQKLTKAGDKIKDELLIKNVRVDMELPLTSVTGELQKELLKFAPFGYGNPEPTFSAKKVQVEDCRLIGKEKTHIKLILSQNSNTPTPQCSSLDAIGFKMGEHYPKIKHDKPIDIVYSIEENTWQNKKSIQLKLRHLQVL